jgi:hypothetical protein
MTTEHTTDRAARIARSITGVEATITRTGMDSWSAAPIGYDITLTIWDRATLAGSIVVCLHRHGLETDWHSPETAREIFAALCHLGCA